MPDTLGNFLQLALTVLTLTSLAGLGLMRGTVTTLREALTDARGEIADKGRRLTETETEITRLKAKVNSQTHDLEAMGRLIRGESYWTELGEKLDSHHSEAKTHWQADERKLDTIARNLAGLRTDLGKQRGAR